MISLARLAQLGASGLTAMLLLTSMQQLALASDASAPGVAVGAQYDSTHVYVAPADLAAFVTAFSATFGGQPSKRIEGNILPVSSHTSFQYVMTPVGTLSVFAFDTPIPFPFGSERTGYLVTDMDRAITAARASGGAKAAGALVLSAPYQMADRRSAMLQFPGGYIAEVHAPQARATSSR